MPTENNVQKNKTRCLAPLPERRKLHRESQTKYFLEKRQGSGKRVRVLAKTFQRLEKIGAAVGAPTARRDRRISKAKEGLIKVMSLPSLTSIVKESLLHFQIPKESPAPSRNVIVSGGPDVQLRRAFLLCQMPLPPQLRTTLLDIYHGRWREAPQKIQTRELWVPTELGPQLQSLARQIQKRGAVGFVAKRNRPGSGAVIDWLVQHPRVCLALETTTLVNGE